MTERAAQFPAAPVEPHAWVIPDSMNTIKAAIREHFKSIGASSVVSSDGIERVYYNGFSLDKLADAVAARQGRMLGRLRKAIKPFADIALAQDADTASPDMIEAVDLAISPSDVRAAREAFNNLDADFPNEPQEALNREQIARTLAYEEWPLADEWERRCWENKHWQEWLRHADSILALLRSKEK